MPKKKKGNHSRRTKPPAPTWGDLLSLRRQLTDIQQLLQINAAALERVTHMSEANFRRTAELQHEIDRIKKLLAVA